MNLQELLAQLQATIEHYNTQLYRRDMMVADAIKVFGVTGSSISIKATIASGFFLFPRNCASSATA